ncbi:MAG: AraC family transcriptional regulator [Planctomycetota bacterium]
MRGVHGMGQSSPQHPLDVMESEIQASSASHAWRGFGIAIRKNQRRDSVEMAAGHSAHLVVVHAAGNEQAEQHRGGVSHRGRPAVGQCNVLPAEQGLSWAWRSTTRPRSLHLWLDPDFLNDVADDITGGRRTSVEVRHAFDESDAEIWLLSCAMSACLTEPGWSTLRAETVAFRAATHLMHRYGDVRGPFRHAGTRALDAATTRRVLEFIHDQLGARLGLLELAGVAGLSRGHFARAFRLATGMPPHRYVLAARLEQAIARLQAGAAPIAVASEVGFADQAHLTRWLRRAFGRTPREITRGGIVNGRSWRFPPPAWPAKHERARGRRTSHGSPG